MGGRGIPPLEFYIHGLEMCMKDIVESTDSDRNVVTLRLYTDDGSLSAFRELPRYISNNFYSKWGGIPYIVTSEATDPFWAWPFMAHSDYLVIPPSTFSITAGIFGNPNTKVVHWKQWIDERVAAGDTFWCDLISGLPEKLDHECRLWGCV